MDASKRVAGTTEGEGSCDCSHGDIGKYSFVLLCKKDIQTVESTA